jgi:hypothetical protein
VHEATTTVMDALDYEGGRVVIVLEL